MSKVPSAEIIREYSAAYVAANRKPAPKIIYERGWFLFMNDHSFGQHIDARKRAAEMLEMRERLLNRVAEKAKETVEA